MATSRNFIPISIVAQLFITGLIVFYYIVTPKFNKLTKWCLPLIILLPGLIYSQGIYLINIIAFIAVFELFKRGFGGGWFNKWFIYIAVLISVLSIFVYVFDGVGLYNSLQYTNQLIPSQTRLLGLDGSPAILSVITSLALLTYLKKPNHLGSILCFILLVVTLLWCGSRTAIFSFIPAFLIAITAGWIFSTIILICILMPIFLTFIYLSYSFEVYYIIELITSFRIVNWVNALTHFTQLPLYEQLFGIGHMPKLTEAYLAESMFDGTYKYKFVTYPESGNLKLLINLGWLTYIYIMVCFFKLNSAVTSYSSRVIISFIVLSAFSYDAVYSIQYFFIMGLLFKCYFDQESGAKNVVN